jgi:hypothetical protein
MERIKHESDVVWLFRGGFWGLVLKMFCIGIFLSIILNLLIFGPTKFAIAVILFEIPVFISVSLLIGKVWKIMRN